jgi:hypothetical protein
MTKGKNERSRRQPAARVRNLPDFELKLRRRRNPATEGFLVLLIITEALSGPVNAVVAVIIIILTSMGSESSSSAHNGGRYPILVCFPSVLFSHLCFSVYNNFNILREKKV